MEDLRMINNKLNTSIYNVKIVNDLGIGDE